MRRLLLAALIAFTALPLSAQTCDRTCLRDFLDQYFAALIQHDPTRLPLSSTVRITEDGVEIAAGQGMWKTATAMGAFRQDVLDVKQSTAGSHAILLENGKPLLYVVRMKIFGLRIHEIETAILRNPQQTQDTVSVFSTAAPRSPAAATPANLAPLAELRRAFSIVPPKDRRLTRDALVDMAKRNFVDPGIHLRVAAVDEEMGIVWQRVSAPDGSVMWVMSKLYGGLFQARHLMQWSLAPGTPSGWD